MDDLISRQQVLKIIHDEMDYSDSVYATSVCLTIDKAVQELPSIEPRKGRWLDQIWAEEEATGLIVPLYMCDQCHTLNGERGNFCSNCGAMMEEGKTDV